MSVVHLNSLLVISTILLLGGCASSPQNTSENGEIITTSSLGEIIEARSYLETAQSMNNEWRVAHPLTGNNAMGLGDMLALSEKAETEGELDRAREIALLVSTYSRLAITQSRSNHNARPSYPRN